MPLDPNASPLSDPAAGESIVVPTQVAQTHRRGLIMLIGVAAVLLLGVVGAVVLMVTSSDDDAPLGLGHTSQIDNVAPRGHRAPRRTRATLGPGSAATNPKQIVRPHFPGVNTSPSHPTQVEEPSDPNLKRLGADEIEDMAAKQGEGTKRCYMRAQKGALGFEIAGHEEDLGDADRRQDRHRHRRPALRSRRTTRSAQCLISRIKAGSSARRRAARSASRSRSRAG